MIIIEEPWVLNIKKKIEKNSKIKEIDKNFKGLGNEKTYDINN